MKKFQILLFFMALCGSISATTEFSVKFLATDSTGEGEPYATVRIYTHRDTSKVMTMGVTDMNGKFSKDLPGEGTYRLTISAVGKTETERTFTVNRQSPRANLGTIVLGSNANALQEVTVTAQAPLVTNEIDRLTYNIQSDEESKTKTIFDMLRKVPLVSVDGQDNIMVKGSSNFKIYKNGHPDPSISQNPKEVLKSIPASMIKKVEVITEPGAKYDAEGVSAILNIVTINNTTIDGVVGTVTVGARNIGDFEKTSPGTNAYLTTQVGKLITSINYGYRHQPKKGNEQSSYSETHYNKSGNSLIYNGEAVNSVNVHYGNIEASFEPDTLNLLTLSFGGYYYDYANSGTWQYSMLDQQNNTIYSYTQQNRSPASSYYSLDGRFDYQHNTRVKGEALTLSYMLSTSRRHNRQKTLLTDRVNTPFPYTGYGLNSRENFWEHTFQLDWTRPFAQHHKFETGVKYIYRLNKSHSLMDYADAESLNTDTRFNHLTQVASAYASYTFTIDKWAARAGLRYEHSYLSAKYPDGNQQNFHRNLGDWVPSTSLNYQINMFNSLKWSFATRINRPGIYFLNPAITDTPTSKSYGNSKLGSTRHYSTSLTFMHTGQKFTFNIVPGFSYSNNGICAVQWADGDKTVSTYANAMRSLQANASSFVQWQIFENTSFMFNGNLGYDHYKNSNMGIKSEGWESFFWAQLTQQLPWKLRLSAGGYMWKSAPDLYGHSNSMGTIDAGLQRSFLKDDRLTMSLNGKFSTTGRYMHYKYYTDRGDYTSFNDYRFNGTEISVSVSYRFGSLKASVKKTNTTIENSDLMGGKQGGGGK